MTGRCVEFAVVNTERENIDGGPQFAVIRELRFDASLVNSEMKLAMVRLRICDTAVCIEAKMKTSSSGKIELAQNIALNIIRGV